MEILSTLGIGAVLISLVVALVLKLSHDKDTAEDEALTTNLEKENAEAVLKDIVEAKTRDNLIDLDDDLAERVRTRRRKKPSADIH